MTKTQQKLARQAITFLNCGGKALTALLRMLLLSVAVVFEGISRIFLVLEVLIERDVNEAERAQKNSQVRSITFKAVPNGERGRSEGGHTLNPAPALAATAAARGHHA